MGDAAKNDIGLFATICMVMGSIIGAGIFMLPVSLGPLGWNAAIGWALTSAGAVCLAFTLSRLARGGNGIQAHVQEVFGPLPAFVAAWSFWFANSTSTGALAITAASVLSRLEPQLGAPSAVTSVAAIFVVAMTAVNALGIRAAGRTQIVTTLIKIVPMLAVIVLLMLRELRAEPLHSLAPISVSIDRTAAAATLTLFGLTGFEAVTAPVNKIREPLRTLPLAMIGGTALVALLYVLSCTAVLLLLGSAVATNSPAPFADALASEWGEPAVALAAVCIAISALGCVNVGLLAAGELAYSMASNGDLPKVLARTKRDGTPVFSHCLAGTLGVGMIVLNAGRSTASVFTFIILVSTVGTLVMYLIASIAAFATAERLWVRLIMCMAILFSLFAFYGAGFEASAWGIFLVVAGIGARFATRHAESKRKLTAAT
jgi:APA family basic amino acid/polyamine antiporter